MKVYILIKTFDMSDDLICGVYEHECDAVNDRVQFGEHEHVIKEFEVIK
jgi:hypothetical protein